MTLPRRRLDFFLSRYGYCSRREAPEWIRAGRVQVDGVPAFIHDQKARVDEVTIDGAGIECPRGLAALLHKPAGCVCTHAPDEGKVVYELVPGRWSRRHPPVVTAGRLDKDTTGVLLMTDTGRLLHRWTAPQHKVEKVYEVTVEGPLHDRLVGLFASGELRLDGEDTPCDPARLEILGPNTARLTLTEGRYHQVKRMFASQGCVVTRLHRSRFGEFTLDGLAPGQWRLLDFDTLLAGARG